MLDFNSKHLIHSKKITERKKQNKLFHLKKS